MQKHPNTKDKATRTMKNKRTKQSTKGANTKTKKVTENIPGAYSHTCTVR